VDPAEYGLVVPPDVNGAGSGVKLPGGDEVQGLETLAGARVGGVQRGAAQVFQALAPLGQLDADHSNLLVWLLGWTIPPDTISPRPRIGNSGSRSDCGLVNVLEINLALRDRMAELGETIR